MSKSGAIQESDDEIPSYLTKKRTIIKDRVGCVRSSIYDLPPETFTYGAKATNPDAEGAGDIISNWVTANPSAVKQTQKMVVAQNILAVKKGAITAKAMRQYCLDHPNVRMKEVLTQDSSRPDVIRPSHVGPFGRKTEYADESITSLVQGSYTNFANDDADYPTITTIKKTGHMPESNPTVASLSIQRARKEKEKAQEQKKKFCMKKFQNVPARGGYGQRTRGGPESPSDWNPSDMSSYSED